MTMFFAVKALILVSALFSALYYDIKEQKIKNFITMPVALMGIVINFLEQGQGGVMYSLQGWVIPIVSLMLLYYVNVMGAGDIKLFAAIGAIMGLPFVLYSFIYTVLIGGVIALVILVKRKEFLIRMAHLYTYFKFIILSGRIPVYSNKEDKSSKFIFSTAIVPGTLIQFIIIVLNPNGFPLF